MEPGASFFVFRMLSPRLLGSKYQGNFPPLYTQPSCSVLTQPIFAFSSSGTSGTFIFSACSGESSLRFLVQVFSCSTAH
jgi:hypothetical protein